VRLERWGRWCRGKSVTGYPRASAFVHAGTGDRAPDGSAYMPPDIEEIDRIIATMPGANRQPIIVMYTMTGPIWFKALRAGVPRETFRRRVITAERWIDARLRVDVLICDAQQLTLGQE